MKTTGNTEFSTEIGGANELFLALQDNQFDVPVGDSKKFFK